APVPWLDRLGGRQLSAWLQPGDAVVVAGLAPVFTSREDVIAILEHWLGQGIALHVASVESRFFPRVVPVSFCGALGEVLLRALKASAALDTSCRGEAIRAGLRARKGQGWRYTNYPGYGYRWGGRGRGKKRVLDEYEGVVMSKIVDWRQAGYS